MILASLALFLVAAAIYLLAWILVGAWDELNNSDPF